ncbi:hypothetical protein [Actinacidiphila oryziradicis]|nr:hypothetical protein [Actinacidiphila oryziradicis]
MASVMGLLEARETAALVRVDELREEAERVLAELREAEAVLERRAIFMKRMATKVARKLDNGVRRLREADRYTRHPVSQYIVRTKDHVRRGTRRVPEKVITLSPAILD